MVRDLDGLVARLRTLPVPRIYGSIELGAMALAATSGAYLIWTILTPVGAYGNWKVAGARGFDPAADMAVLARFDPFNRGTAAGATNVVTALPLKLFGISLNTASGRGSAIIEVESLQSSFAVGDEVMAGVVLKAVAFDHVVLTRGGVEELLYVDQSTPAETAAPEGGAPAPAAGGMTLDALAASVRATPRVQNGQTTGLVLSAADPDQLSAAGFEPGDIVTRVNGEAVTSIEELLERAATPRADGAAIFTVERAGQVQTVRMQVAR
jgi:general secretion pathway protein C